MTTIYDSPTTPSTRSHVPSQGVRLLAILEQAVAACADVDPAELDSGRTRGRELLDLAALARETTAALGGEAGTVVTTAPGVVVVRELVAATRLLRSATAATADR